MIIAAQFLGHLKHSWNLNWPFDLWLGFWLGLPFDLSGLWLQEFQVVPEKMHLKIMQLQFHQLHFIKYVKLQQNQSVVQSKEKSSKCLRYCASISVTVHLSDDKSHMKFVSKSKCPYPASLWSLRSRGTWSTWNTGVTLKIYIDTWSEHQTGVSKQENRHDQSDMEYYSMNVSDHVTYGGSPSPGVSWITLWTKSIKSISRISLQRKWNILNYIVLTGKTGVNGVRLCNSFKRAQWL